MKINIFGSTGVIGQKTLRIIKNYFPNLRVNLLCANSNIGLLSKQIKLFKPKYIYINNEKKLINLKSKINNKTKILTKKELINYLISSKSDFSILAISGFKSLNFLEEIIKNTDNLGIVSKEAIVSAGHLFYKKGYFNKTNIFPLDSEHFSLFDYFRDIKNNNKFENIILTASGGPFYKKKFRNLDNIKFAQAIKHPKWKMGYKNSIDSATMVNKCLEIVEAHYLFNVPYDNIKILIHPEAIIHSIVENKNYVSNMNLFKNDMSIPIINFLAQSANTNIYKKNKNLNISSYKNFNFYNVSSQNFPIFHFFNNLDKSNPANIIKFNIGNEIAVNYFKNNLIKYTDIYRIIKKACSLNLYSSLNTIKEVIQYHEEFESKMYELFKNKF